MQDGFDEQARRGDAEAFDSRARLAGDRCLEIAVRNLRGSDLAENAVQAALITAWIELRARRDRSLRSKRDGSHTSLRRGRKAWYRIPDSE